LQHAASGLGVVSSAGIGDGIAETERAVLARRMRVGIRIFALTWKKLGNLRWWGMLSGDLDFISSGIVVQIDTHCVSKAVWIAMVVHYLKLKHDLSNVTCVTGREEGLGTQRRAWNVIQHGITASGRVLDPLRIIKLSFS